MGDISTEAKNGGVGGGSPDPLDERTAFLYHNFFWGTLKDYNHSDADANDLQNIGELDDSFFILVNDIDLESYTWLSIEVFRGNLNGNGYVIRNLNLKETSSTGNYGLIRLLEGQIENLKLENVEFDIIDNESSSISIGSIAAINNGIIKSDKESEDADLDFLLTVI